MPWQAVSLMSGFVSFKANFITFSASQFSSTNVQGALPCGPAKRSGALRGNRILAATDAAGAWMDFCGLQLDEIASVIRGKPGTSISLQVQSPNQTIFRTVSITREQIIGRAL